jgi:hypothetical protein
MSSNLVDPDRCKLRRFPVNDPPQHRMTNAAVDPIPAGAICLTRLNVGNLPENQGPGASSQFDLVEMGIRPLECGLFE